MTGRSARTIISLLMLTCLLTLGVSALIRVRENHLAGQVGSTIGGIAGSGTLPSGKSGKNAALTNLQIQNSETEKMPAAGLVRWPAKSSIELIRQPDMKRYIGRKQTQKPLSGITVILDAGHGGKDGGASFPFNSLTPEIVEKNISLAVAAKAKFELEAMGAAVLMTRETDTWRSVYSRIAIASKKTLERFIADLPLAGKTNSAVSHLSPQLDSMISINSDTAESGGRGPFKGVGADLDQRLIMDIGAQYPDILFISLHCNAIENDSLTSGLVVFYETTEKVYAVDNAFVQYQDPKSNPPGYSLYNDQARLRLATLIEESVTTRKPELKHSTGKAVITGDYAILREMNLISTLVEMGYVTNQQDRQLLLSDSGQQQIAKGVADAVYNYYCTNDANGA